MLLLLVARGAAATLTVGPFGDYPTVNEAEAAAASGDTLELAAGVYFEVLDPGGKDLTYTAPAGATISATDPCLAVDEGEHVVVDGLTFDACSHAIAVSAGASVTARDVVFSANTCDDGCAVTASDGATVIVTGGRFESNLATGYGGSIYATSGASVTVSDATFSGGEAAYGGAIAVDSTGTLTLDGVTIAGGVAEEGGGVWAAAGDLDLVGVRFVGNTATGTGGGLHSQGAPSLRVASSAFLGNAAGGDGAGLHSLDAAVSLTGTVFLENETGSSGGGVYVEASTFDAENVSLACNVAVSEGGGLAVYADDTVVTAVLATANVGGGLAVHTSGFSATENLSWGNTGGEWTGVTDPTRTNGNLWLNPRVRFLACDGDWTSDDLAPGAGSSLVDGAPSLGDTDGSPGDIGAYGGVAGAVLDVDDDGATYWAGDCHEGRADAHPGASEAWYDGIDQDCDGRDDDQDADGYERADDCDDTDVAVNPARAETWYDGVDQDCDGNDDDQDVDGYALADDCNDVDATVNPGRAEAWYDGTDQDCDGNDDDQDVDGYALADDCNDVDATVNPGRAEAWYDGTDQDCDGNDDDQDVDGYALADDCDDRDPDVRPDAVETWYDGIDQDCDGNDLDRDGDGEGYFDDCDDDDPTAFPGAEEVWYDGVDQDCDGNDADRDGDTYAGGTDGVDCDDLDAAVNPGADEIWYDGVDQDCDGVDDADQDGDGWVLGEDCDDLDATVNPDAEEVWYDGIDADCAGDDDADQDGDDHAAIGEGAGDDCDDTDAAIAPGVAEVWYDGVDQDCDGNDDDQDADGTPVATDCDDTDATVAPGADEIWYDGVDQDCDGRDDDRDGDGVLHADDCDDTDADVVRCLARIDGGCDAGRGPPGWLLAVAAAVLLAGRRAAPLLLLSGPALALDATGTGRAPVDAGGLVRVGGMAAGAAGTLDVALGGGWAGTTAEATYDDGSTAPLVAGLATLEIGAGWTFLDGLRVEAGLPVVLGATVPATMGPGVGDAWAAVHWAVLRRDVFSFGPVAEVQIPSGDPARLSGGGGVGGALLAAASGRAGRVRWRAEVGGGVRAAGAYDRLTFAPEPELRFGGGARVTVAGPFSVGAEGIGRLGLGAQNAVALSTSGAEGLLSAGLSLPHVDLLLAGGAGLLDGVGTPDARVLLSVRSRLLDPGPGSADMDQDGVPDDRDRCPGEREDQDSFQDDDGCVDDDDDADGIPDADDRCPANPEDRDFVQDADGCPDLDDDADGLPDVQDRCPRDAGPAESNGCPDRDGDGLLDAADACPDDGEVPGTDLAHSDGCPGAVAVFPDRLHLADPVTFDPGRATLRPDGAAVVGAVAAVLQRWPDLATLEIGVHVDDTGNPAADLALTQARADVVRKALVAAGVAPGRLVAKGYGATSPLVSGSERVEFVIVRR